MNNTELDEIKQKMEELAHLPNFYASLVMYGDCGELIVNVPYEDHSLERFCALKDYANKVETYNSTDPSKLKGHIPNERTENDWLCFFEEVGKYKNVNLKIEMEIKNIT